MIIYDLKCKNNHQFEGWFRDRAAFEKQKVRNLISCPVCGDYGAEIVLASVTVMGKDGRSYQKDPKEINQVKALQIFHEFIEKHFDNVEERFADVAFRIHKGEEETRNIRGTTTKEEEEMLSEEGVQFFKIPVPKFDS